MPKKPNNKMPILERAKQFAPFAALTGFDYAIQDQNKVIIEKRDLEEDKIEEINNSLKLLLSGDSIKLTYYEINGYKIITGKIHRINNTYKYIEIDDKRIEFDNIYDIAVDF